MDMIGSTDAYVELTTHKRGAAQVRGQHFIAGFGVRQGQVRVRSVNQYAVGVAWTRL